MKKYKNDNIWGLILFDDELLYELFESFEFKRLGRINHLGMTNFIYPPSSHTRLSHSLGVYELSRVFIENIKPDISNNTLRAIKISALLHDIGHGIYSHIFEMVSVHKHEKYTIQIINDETTEINQILTKYDKNLVKEVTQIIEGKHKRKWVNQLISSEVDVDRLDYLRRDSIMTGTSYGVINFEWIVKNAKIIEDNLVFDIKALSAIEEMILARFHMNQSIYNNVKNVANSTLFLFFFRRIEFLLKNNKLINDYNEILPILLKKPLTTSEFLALDDNIFYLLLLRAQTEKDEILRKITNKIINQKSPSFTLDKDEIKIMKHELNENEFEQTWNIVKLKYSFSEYQSSRKEEVIIYDGNEMVKIRDLSTVIPRKIKKDNKKEVGIKL